MARNPYLGIEMQKHLETLRDEAKALASSRIIATDAERAIMILLQRITETLVDGSPTTQAPKRHHE